MAQVLRDQAHHAARLHRAELGGVPGEDHPGAARAGHGLNRGQIGGGHLGGLVDHHHVPGADPHGALGPAVFQAAKELGDVVRLGQALAGHDPGRVGQQGHADHPAAGPARPGPGERGHGVGLARPGRGHQHRHSRPGGQQPGGHLGLGRIQPSGGHRGLRLRRG